MLTVDKGSMDDGAPVAVRRNVYAKSQIWTWKHAIGHCVLVNRRSGKCLNLSGGPKIGQWPGRGPDNEWFVLKNKHNDMCVDVPYGSLGDNGAEVWQWPRNDTDAQRFRLVRITYN